MKQENDPRILWLLPTPGVNFPSKETFTYKTYTKDGGSLCSVTKLESCHGISSEHKNVIVYIYPTGAVLNPHIITGYATRLIRDCFSDPPTDLVVCELLKDQLNYLESAGIQIDSETLLWLVDEGNYPDAMVQSGIALLFYNMAQRYPEKNSDYVEITQKAGAAFDRTWSRRGSRYGVAHIYDDNHYWYIAGGVNEKKPRYTLNVMNKALVDLHELKNVTGEEKWDNRIQKGLNTLRRPEKRWPSVDKFNIPRITINGLELENWSYHRIGPSTAVASLGYHKLNYDTLKRLVSRGYDSEDGILNKYATLWELSYKRYKERFSIDCENDDYKVLQVEEDTYLYDLNHFTDFTD